MTTTQSAGTLRVIRAGDRCPDQASGAMLREAAIAESTVGAQKIWLGYVELGPGLVSAVHHHGEAESRASTSSRATRAFSAASELDQAHEAHAGDFVWVPPHMVHVEMNTSQASRCGWSWRVRRRPA